jgi:hypothetical protein
MAVTPVFLGKCFASRCVLFGSCTLIVNYVCQRVNASTSCADTIIQYEDGGSGCHCAQSFRQITHICTRKKRPFQSLHDDACDGQWANAFPAFSLGANVPRTALPACLQQRYSSSTTVKPRPCLRGQYAVPYAQYKKPCSCCCACTPPNPVPAVIPAAAAAASPPAAPSPTTPPAVSVDSPAALAPAAATAPLHLPHTSTPEG